MTCQPCAHLYIHTGKTPIEDLYSFKTHTYMMTYQTCVHLHVVYKNPKQHHRTDHYDRVHGNDRIQGLTSLCKHKNNKVMSLSSEKHKIQQREIWRIHSHMHAILHVYTYAHTDRHTDRLQTDIQRKRERERARASEREREKQSLFLSVSLSLCAYVHICNIARM